MKIERVSSTNKYFIELIRKLDVELHNRYSSQQFTYDKHNLIDPINTAIIGCIDDRPVACGCFKIVDDRTVEIKRMYVVDDLRRKGLSKRVLQALENWSAELGYSTAILETGKGQPEAIGLYKKCGYEIIDNYGPYKNLDNSICMKKAIT